LNDERKYTLALGLAEFTGLYSLQWRLRMAAAAVAVLPAAALFSSLSATSSKASA
jgi:multiple sugar transport system permease protein